MSKALYFRIGIDTGRGGFIAPIFQDGTFEYIPIPDSTTTEITYEKCEGLHGQYLSAFLPTHLHKGRMHYDPDFRGKVAVYGDTTSQQGKLKKLNEDNMLIFYAGLTPSEEHFRNNIDLYFIGYIIVDDVLCVTIDNISDQPPNAHSKSFEYIQLLGGRISDIYNIDQEQLIARAHIKNVNYNLNIIKKALEINKILYDLDLWNQFIINNKKETVIDVYTYLLNLYSKFTLVKGKTGSRLFKKALKISRRSKNKLGNLENVVSDEWSEILGIPKGLSLQRKNPRFVPNPNYGNKGDYDKLKQILLNQK